MGDRGDSNYGDAVVEIAIWIVGIWFAVSLIASPMIGLLGRANDEPSQRIR